MRLLWQIQTMHCRYFDTTRKGNHSTFLTPTMVGGQRPLLLKFALKATHPFEKRRLRHISAYNVSTVRDSEKRSTMTNRQSTTGFPTSYIWRAYVTLSPQRVVQKRFFVFFCLNKLQLQSNKVCYHVSLCENIQRQSCIVRPFPYLRSIDIGAKRNPPA